MTDRPILFSAPMVRALLESRKTQTRRALKLPSWTKGMDCTGRLYMYERQEGHERHGLEFLPHGRTLWHPQYNPRGSSGAYLRVPIMSGDRLWVREGHHLTDDGEAECVVYLADEKDAKDHRDGIRRIQQRLELSDEWATPHLRKRPSIHMPRWASRLTLTVTDVRVERLQNISDKDAVSEGWPGTSGPDTPKPPVIWFRDLWNSLNAERAPWDSNPWVVAYSFEVAHANIDEATS